jgi:putative sigma-54 modulation protein
VEIAVHGRHIEVPRELKKAAEDKIGHLGRYLEGMERAEVRFFEERNPRIAEPVGCEVTVSGHGHVVRARATGQDLHAALDRVVDKVGHRLSRLKSRLVGRSHPHHHSQHHNNGAAPVKHKRDGAGLEPLALEARFVLETEPDEDEVWGDDGEGGRRIVRTKRLAIKPVSPAEAALQMELLSHDFYFFSNSETGRPAVLYRRSDGDFGLIDAT